VTSLLEADGTSGSSPSSGLVVVETPADYALWMGPVRALD
jgi:hypothetical protein